MPSQRNPEQTRSQLREWLVARPGVTDVEVHPFNVPQDSGYSNETILLNATWKDHGTPQGGPLVLRIAPVDGGLFPDTPYDDQLRLVQILGNIPGSKVPRVPYAEPDPSVFGAPFFLMEQIDGVVPEDSVPYPIMGWLHEAPTEIRRAVWTGGVDRLAFFHNLDPVAHGLEFVDRPDLGGEGLEQTLNYYQHMLEWTESQGRPQPLIHAALDRLRADRPTEDPAGYRFCWGDSRIGNMMFRRETGEVVACLDWEMASIGEPTGDLAWFVYFDEMFNHTMGVARLEGFSSNEEAIEQWQDASNRDVHEFDYRRRLCGVIFSIILSRIAQRTPPGYMDQVDHIANAYLALQFDLPKVDDPHWGADRFTAPES